MKKLSLLLMLATASVATGRATSAPEAVSFESFAANFYNTTALTGVQAEEVEALRAIESARISTSRRIPLPEGNYRPVEVTTKTQDKEPYMKYIYLYDEKGSQYSTDQSMVRIYQRWNKVESRWDNFMRLKLIFDENGDLVKGYTDNGFEQEWDNQYLVAFEYDGKHNPLGCVQHKWVDGAWMPTLKWDNEYDANDRIVKQTYFTSSTGVEWIHGSQWQWTYDYAGRELSEKVYRWSDKSEKYSLDMGFEKTYDADGNTLKEVRYQGGVLFSIKDMTYDENGNNLTLTEVHYTDNEPVNYSNHTYTYDEQNRMLESIGQMWDVESSEWANSRRATYQYASNGTTLSTFWKWNTELGDWEKDQVHARYVDEQGRDTSFVVSNWDKANNRTESVSRISWTYDSNGNMTSYLDEAWLGKEPWWLPLTKMEMTYDEKNRCIAIDCPGKQEKEVIYGYYNDMKDQWGCPDFESYYAELEYLDLRERVAVTGVEMNKTELQLETEFSERLLPNVAPSNAHNKEVYWTTSNEEVATVTVDGKVKAVAPGEAIIAARTLDGFFTAECKVTVFDEVEAVKGIDAEAAFTLKGKTVMFNGNKEVTVYGIEGSVVFTGNTDAVDMSGFEKGVYLITFSSGAENRVIKIAL